MTKRRNPLDEAIERLAKVHQEETEDLVQGQQASELASRLKAIAPEVESLTENVRRMGRHARAAERKKSYKKDLDCYRRVEQFHRDGLTDGPRHRDLTLIEAFEEVGRESQMSGNAVSKAYYRAKRRLRWRVS